MTCGNKKPFDDNAALGKHLKLKDRTDRTVIAVRVQNEPGIIGSSRDYSPEALSVYEGPVPAKLVTRIQPSGKGIMFDIRQKSGSNKSGAWPALFSWEAGEIKTTWKQEYQFLVNIFIVWPPLSG